MPCCRSVERGSWKAVNDATSRVAWRHLGLPAARPHPEDNHDHALKTAEPGGINDPVDFPPEVESGEVATARTRQRAERLLGEAVDGALDLAIGKDGNVKMAGLLRLHQGQVGPEAKFDVNRPPRLPARVRGVIHFGNPVDEIVCREAISAGLRGRYAGPPGEGVNLESERVIGRLRFGPAKLRLPGEAIFPLGDESGSHKREVSGSVVYG